jgi:hypothetical protein
LLVPLIAVIKSEKLNTGPGYIYPLSKNVTVDFMSIDPNVNAYYQFFETLDPKKFNKLIFYFGKNITGSAQETAYMGVYPYTFLDKAPGIRVHFKKKKKNPMGTVLPGRVAGLESTQTVSTI